MNGRWVQIFGIGGLLLILGIGVFYGVPAIGAWADATFNQGLGLRRAALIAFSLAFVMILVMAAVAGDGLLGELHVMIPGFLLFFVICWLMLAWVF